MSIILKDERLFLICELIFLLLLIDINFIFININNVILIFDSIS